MGSMLSLKDMFKKTNKLSALSANEFLHLLSKQEKYLYLSMLIVV